MVCMDTFGVDCHLQGNIHDIIGQRYYLHGAENS